jgi:hypothetical protein
VSGSRMGGTLRRAIGTLLTLALVAAAVAFYLGSPRLSATSGTEPVTTAEPAATESPSRSASPKAAPTPTLTETAAKVPGSSPHRNLPPGPGGREPGIRLTAAPTSGGAFDVVETVRLAAPVTRLTIAAPVFPATVRSLRGTHPVVEALTVTAGGRSVELSTRTVRRTMVVHLSQPADLFELRYRLGGVTVLNTPSSPGRALGGVKPMVVEVPEEFPVAIAVRGQSVRNLSCPCLPVDDQACAAGPRPKMRVNRNLALRDAMVLVQFDLGDTGVGAPR